MSLIATLVCFAIAAGLLYLDRDAQERTSNALWIPVIWMWIVGSRAVSQWAGYEPVANLSQRNAEGSPLDAAIYGLLIFAGLLVLNFRSHKVRSFLRANGPILLFLAFCALSVLWSESPFVAMKRWIKGMGVFVMVLVVATESDPVAALRRLLSCVTFVLLPASVLVILFFPQLGTSVNEWSHITYYSGVSTQKNGLGWTCLICGLGSLWSFLCAYQVRDTAHRFQRMFAHGLMVVTAIGLIKTCDSMTSMATLGVAGMVMVLTTQSFIQRRPRNIHIVLGFAAIVMALASFMDAYGAVLSLLGRDATLTGRTDIWKAVLSFHTNPLIGAGYESFWLGGRIERVATILGYTGIAEAHNGYLELYLDMGWIGLAFLAALTVSGYREVVAGFAANPRMGSIRLVFLTVGIVCSMTEAGFAAMTPIWFVFLLANTHLPRSQAVWNEQAYTQPTFARREEVPRRVRVLR